MRASVFTCLMLLATLTVTQFALPQFSLAQSATPTQPDLFSGRNAYREAVSKLRTGQLAAFDRIADRLQDYPLYPYLAYHRLRHRLAHASPDEIGRFMAAHGDLPVAPLLYQRWLKRLGNRREWRQLLEHRIETSNAELNCLQLRAAYNTGKRDEALAAVESAWTRPASQPKACDPLFEVWRKSPWFTEQVAWRRFAAALAANEVTLARYLQRYFSGERKLAAEAFYAVHVQPERLSRQTTYRKDTPAYRQIVLHALPRLARRDADAAARLAPAYLQRLDFNAAQATAIRHAVAIAQANEGTFPDADERSKLQGESVATALTRAAVAQQNWPETLYWAEQIPLPVRHQARWQYWLARALDEVIPGSERARLAFTSLAEKRHYYGFLAARKLGLDGRLNAQTPATSRIQLAQFATREPFRRGLELFAVGDELNGRREWYAAVQKLPPAERVLAAELAMQHGLLSLAIATANQADAVDHLHLRFPVAYDPQLRQASLRTNVPTPLLLAIARQESALDHRARSTAGARGLMQLMPATARLVASRSDRRAPSGEDLYDPQTNIALGAWHLAWLIERYQQQTPLAIAAYNAGEHRVDRWIRDHSGTPADVWIETIPFRETRNYVKNVLAFRYVYANLMQSRLPFLTFREAWVAETD